MELVKLIKEALNIRVRDLKLLTWNDIAERMGMVYKEVLYTPNEAK